MASKDDHDSSEQKALPVVWGPGHKIFYANAFHLRTSDSEVMIELGTIQDINGVDSLLSTNQLVLSTKSAKLFSLILSGAVQELEKRFGEIKIDPKHLEALLHALSDRDGSKS